MYDFTSECKAAWVHIGDVKERKEVHQKTFHLQMYSRCYFVKNIRPLNILVARILYSRFEAQRCRRTSKSRRWYVFLHFVDVHTYLMMMSVRTCDIETLFLTFARVQIMRIVTGAVSVHSFHLRDFESNSLVAK